MSKQNYFVVDQTASLADPWKTNKDGKFHLILNLSRTKLETFDLNFEYFFSILKILTVFSVHLFLSNFSTDRSII